MVPYVLIGRVSGVMPTLFKVCDACIILIHFYYFYCFYCRALPFYQFFYLQWGKKEEGNRLKTEEGKKEKEKKKEEKKRREGEREAD